jgi:hypothetical protein
MGNETSSILPGENILQKSSGLNSFALKPQSGMNKQDISYLGKKRQILYSFPSQEEKNSDDSLNKGKGEKNENEFIKHLKNGKVKHQPSLNNNINSNSDKKMNKNDKENDFKRAIMKISSEGEIDNQKEQSVRLILKEEEFKFNVRDIKVDKDQDIDSLISLKILCLIPYSKISSFFQSEKDVENLFKSTIYKYETLPPLEDENTLSFIDKLTNEKCVCLILNKNKTSLLIHKTCPVLGKFMESNFDFYLVNDSENEKLHEVINFLSFCSEGTNAKEIINENIKKIDELETNLKTSTKKLVECENKLLELQTESNKKLKQLHSEHESTKCEFQKQLSIKQKELESLRVKENSLKEEFADIETTFTEVLTTNKNLHLQIDNLNVDNAKLMEICKNFEEQIKNKFEREKEKTIQNSISMSFSRFYEKGGDRTKSFTVDGFIIEEINEERTEDDTEMNENMNYKLLLEQLEEKMKCIVCLKNDRNCLFNECHHLIYCYQCFEREIVPNSKKRQTSKKKKLAFNCDICRQENYVNNVIKILIG